MKPHTLPVKRRPVSKGIFKRLSAVTSKRKQHVAATADGELDDDDNSSKISRALTIIFLIHIVAIGLIFVHQKFLDGRTADEPKPLRAELELPVVAPPAPRRADLPRLSSGEKPYIVRAGDNYARIATREGVEEGDLRLINKHVDIGPGMILSIPPQRIVAAEPPEVTAIREQEPVDTTAGLVDAVDVSASPRAQLIRPNITPVATSSAAGKTYTVQNGDSVWRIANRFKISQDALMKANGISDARKMKTGMSLVIP